jgi:hypothetical protein
VAILAQALPLYPELAFTYDHYQLLGAMPSIDEMYPAAQGNVRRELIRNQFGIDAKTVGGDLILPCGVDTHGALDGANVKILRHPLNDRRYKELEKQYAKRMLTDGYDIEDAGAISLVATNSSRTTWWAIGGATRCKAFEVAYEQDPNNEQLGAFIKAGGFKASFYSEALPEEVVVWLIEELNIRNGLGVSNTTMQKFLVVPRYTTSWNAENNKKDAKAKLATGSAEFVEAQWDHVKKATPLYASLLEWKKVQVLYGSLSSNTIETESDETMTLLQFMRNYYESSVDPLAMQTIEKSRNLVKYMNDLLARILPSRSATGKGRSQKYPALAAEAIKLSLVSTDGIASVLLPDSQLDILNDTYTYSSTDLAAQPAAKKKSKKNESQDASVGKKPLSRVDVIEDMVQDW